VVRSTTRETAYSRAFREIFKFIAGREPERLKIIPQPKVRLSGPVTGTPGGVQNNRPVAGAAVEVFRVVVHLRAATPLGPADAGVGAVVLMSRPRGYFGLPRDVVLLDGKEPTNVKPGVPSDSLTTLRLPAADIGRNIMGLFNEERIVARAWPASENRIAVVELTH